MNILIVQTSFIGDIILSTPVISGVRKLYPRAHITLMTTPVGVGLFQHDPRIQEVISFDKRGREGGIWGLVQKAMELRKNGFDRVYSLHRSHRTSLLLFLARIPWRMGVGDAKMGFLYTQRQHRPPGKHAVVRNLSLLFGEADPADFDDDLELHAPKREALSSGTRDLIASLSPGFVLLAPGSAWRTKQWFEEGFIQVARHFLKKGRQVVLMGGPADKDLCRRIGKDLDLFDLSGKTPLSETLYFVKNAGVLVCNDSMALHMGSAFKIPCVSVFCATSPSFGFGPWKNPNALIVEDTSLECKPCRRHGSVTCPRGDEACMKVPAREVIEACETLLEREV